MHAALLAWLVDTRRTLNNEADFSDSGEFFNEYRPGRARRSAFHFTAHASVDVPDPFTRDMPNLEVMTITK